MNIPEELLYSRSHEALMVEPTETESKEALDSLIKAFTEIYDKALEDPEYIKNAPHNTIIERPDEVSAARHPKLRYIPEDN
jgi:Glycine cleavage system protein P (pyridoxal-binding), C-terminal domain